MENQRVKTTSQQLGEVLFELVFKSSTGFLKEIESSKSFYMESIGQDDIFKELLLIHMFAAVLAFDGFLSDQKLETEVLDHMHEAYYRLLSCSSVVTKKDHNYLISRYREYDEAMGEKRGPNWLWPLSSRMLDNLRRKQTTDAVAVFRITASITSLMKVLPELVNSYAIEKSTTSS